MPAPWIEFGKLAHPQQWWLRREEPPWLDDARWWVRAFRVTLVFGLLGSLSGWLTCLFIYSAVLLGNHFHQGAPAELGFFLGPGMVFGLCTLVPISRWLGRGWIMTLAAIPVSMFANYCGMMAYLFVSPIMSSGPAWVPGGKNFAGLYAGFAGALVIAIWMGHPLRKSAWLAGLLATCLAGMGCQLCFSLPNPPGFLNVSSEVVEFIWSGSLYSTFQCLTAVGLGARFWWVEKNGIHQAALGSGRRETK